MQEAIIYLTLMIIILYILSIKNNRPLLIKVGGYFNQKLQG